MQFAPTSAQRSLHIGSRGQQQTNRVRVTILSRPAQRSRAPLVLRMDVSSGLHQQAHRFRVTTPGSTVQRGAIPGVLRVDIGATRQQSANGLLIAFLGGGQKGLVEGRGGGLRSLRCGVVGPADADGRAEGEPDERESHESGGFHA